MGDVSWAVIDAKEHGGVMEIDKELKDKDRRPGNVLHGIPEASMWRDAYLLWCAHVVSQGEY